MRVAERTVVVVVEGVVEANRASRRRPPGSTDVARLAGVSQKTVSRVFRDEPHVTAEVRDRVLRAARELGYRPNSAARALLSGRTRRIGVVSLGSALYGPASLLLGVERAARGTGYALSVVNTFEGEQGGIAGAIGSLLDQGVDGIVLSEPIDEGPIQIEVDVPVLVLGSMPGLTAPCVIETSDMGEEPAYLATRHLLELGHSTVHHVAGPQRWYSARHRLIGWRRALEDSATSADAALVPVEGDWTAPSGYVAGRQLLERAELTAVFVANDDMAIGVIRAFVEAGLSVPGDVSVVGFDDVPAAAYLNPPLTTMVAEFGAEAEKGLAALVQAIENPQGSVRTRLDSTMKLVVRDSTAPPHPRRSGL